MNCRISLTLSIVALMAIGTSTAQAHNVDLDLEYNNTSEVWELYAEIDANGTGDTNFGLAAVRALIDNVDFGSFGIGSTGTTIAGGIGALNPVMTTLGMTDPVLLTAGGTVDVLYGQDISAAPATPVVGGVGTPRELIATGTFTAGTPPAFGDDDNGLTSDATFLNAATGPFGIVVDADAVVLAVIDVTPGFLLGDADNNGQVDFFDIGSVQSNFGAVAPPTPLPGDADGNGQVDFFDIGAVQSNFGSVAPGAGVASIPEPGTIALLISGMALMFFRRS